MVSPTYRILYAMMINSERDVEELAKPMRDFTKLNRQVPGTYVKLDYYLILSVLSVVRAFKL